MIVSTNHCSYQCPQDRRAAGGRRNQRFHKRRIQNTFKSLSLPSLKPIPEEGADHQEQLDLNRLLLLELTNQERERQDLHLLRESSHLNELATIHAEHMASQSSISHSVLCVDELKQVLGAAIVGENVQSGSSIARMHWESMDDVDCVNKRNIVAPYYQEFGCGVAVSKDDGKIYACQLFRSTPPTTN